MKRRVVVLLLLVISSFWAGWLLRPQDPSVRARELLDALPLWGADNCVPAEADEIARYQLAVHVLEVYGADINWLSVGAQKFLAHGIYRGDGNRVCPPEGLYQMVAEIMAKHNGWRGVRQESGLKLAWRIGVGRPEIIEAVAAVAFSEYPQGSEVLSNKDIRPLARTVLAGFGPDVASFGDIAFALMSSEDSMGTGAAQVAAAAGHPEALQKVTLLMGELLSSVAEDEAIPRDKRNRLYELAYAISFAGEAGRHHLGPILELMDRKVQSWAPPFGMVEIRPKRMCALLHKISAEEPERYPYCLDDEQPYEQ